MSASDQMRNMISQLMGSCDRSDPEGRSSNDTNFEDMRVCKSFLLKCCPNDILQSTRMDMGECTKIHDIALRADYEKAALSKDYRYDVEAYNKLNLFIIDLDKKVELAKIRLKETQAELSEEANSKADSIHKIGETIGVTLAKAEQIGAEGHVEESMKMLEEVEVLKKTKHEAEMEYRNCLPASTYQQQKLRVCEICSAYLGIHDNDRRLADHFGGKLHMGFIEIRAKLDDLRKVVEKKREMREKDADAIRSIRDLKDSEKQTSRDSRDHRSSKDRDRRRSRSRDRSSRKSSRRSRSRSKDKSSSKKSDHRRRSRSRDRSDRHKSDRRHRSRSRERSDRSKSENERAEKTEEKREEKPEEKREEEPGMDGDNKEFTENAEVKTEENEGMQEAEKLSAQE